MLEIVHDLAPGAQLLFANYDTSLAFEQAVDSLSSNADVVVDDISFHTPPYDGTSDVSANTATNLNTDANPIRGYFTAVANQAFDHWGEPFTDSGVNLRLACDSVGDVQLFQATANTTDFNNLGLSLFNPFSLPNGWTVGVFLTWDDPFSGSSNYYDLYLYLISNGNLAAPLAVSCFPNNGVPPAETVTYTNTSGAMQAVGIVIQNINNTSAAKNFDSCTCGRCAGTLLNHWG